MTGILTYLPTLAFVPHAAFVIALVYVLIFRRKKLIAHFKNISKFPNEFLVLMAIAVFSLINYFVGYVWFNYEIGFPYPVLLLATYLIAMGMTEKDLKFVFWLAVFEAVVVIAEFAVGTNSFLPTYKSATYSDEGLLYFSRPMGLSYNSSIVAYKLMIGVFIAEYLQMNSRLYRLAQLLLFAGILLTFSRTIIVVLLVYFAFRYSGVYILGFIKLLKFRISRKLFVFLALFTIVLAGVGLLTVTQIDKISNQFTKGRGNIEFSGREVIWPQFIDFIKENPISGNHSVKFYADYHGRSNLAHAHNSFLQVLADNGIVIFSLYLLLIGMSVNRGNALLVMAFVVYSLTQYGVFWGISLIDIVFMVILFNRNMLPDKKVEVINATPVQ